VWSRTYDGTGRVVSHTDRFGTAVYAYGDDTARPSTVTLPTGEVRSYTYDAFGQVRTIDAGTDHIEHVYDAVGRRRSSDYGNGVTVAYEYSGNSNDWTATQETRGSDEGWHAFAVDNAFVAVRTATPLKAGMNGVNGEREFKASGARNVVIVDSAPMAEYGNDRAAFLQALKARPMTCIGVSAPRCTSPTSAPAVSYTSLKGDRLSIAWPADGSAPVRTVNGIVQNPAQWPVIDNPWVYQAQGQPWMRMSGAGTTRIYHFGEAVTTDASAMQARNWRIFTATLAPNGGFEAGTASTPSQWVQGTWAGSPVYARLASPVHSGTAAGSVTLAAQGNAGFSLNATARPAAVAGQQMTVTAWLRTANVSNGGAADGGAYVYAQYVNDAGALMCSAAVSPPVTGTQAMWQSRSATLPEPCAGATRVAVSVRLKGIGTLWVDDVDYTSHD